MTPNSLRAENNMNKITFQDVNQTTTAQGQTGLGTIACTPDGSIWKYIKTAGALAKGSVAVPNTAVSADLFSSSADQQGRKVYLTKSGWAQTVGAYADFYGVVDDGTGVGQVFKVMTNSIDTLTLYPAYALSTALSVSDSDITLVSPSLVVKSAVTDKAQQAQGIAQVAFASGDYGWILKQGFGTVLAGEVLTIDLSFVTGDDTTGQVVKGTTAKGPFDEQYLGYAMVANAGADQNALVYVNIA